MAEYYFNSEMRKFGGKIEMAADSCGLYANPGSPISPNAAKILESENIACEGHKSKQADKKLIKANGFVYGMTARHAAALKGQFPEFAEKIFCMPQDIGDPYGGSLDDYGKCFEGIKESVDAIIDRMAEEAC
jgi:protein-tyrosine phosphatase